jgi:hypothetical protein
MAKAVFLGIDLSKVNWAYVFYVVISIALVVGAVTKLYPMGTERAVIVAIGFTLVLYFYSQRWFGGKSTKDASLWPPHINTCPDYLTYIPPGAIIPKGGCVDLIGVSSNGGLTKVTDPNSPIEASKVFQYTYTTIPDIKTACNACQQKGLTWEGIYDGDTCGSSKYGSDSGSGPSSENCPV